MCIRDRPSSHRFWAVERSETYVIGERRAQHHGMACPARSRKDPSWSGWSSIRTRSCWSRMSVLGGGRGAGAVVEHEAIPVRGEDKGNVQDLGVPPFGHGISLAPNDLTPRHPTIVLQAKDEPPRQTKHVAVLQRTHRQIAGRAGRLSLRWRRSLTLRWHILKPAPFAERLARRADT